MKKILINSLFQPDNELTNIIKDIHHSTDEIKNVFVKEIPVLQCCMLAESKWYTRLLTNLDTARESVKMACTLVNEKQLLDKDATCLSAIWHIVDIRKELIQLRESAAHWLEDNTPAPDIQNPDELENSFRNHGQGVLASIVNSHSAVLGMMKAVESLINETVTEMLDETRQFDFGQYDLPSKVEQLAISYFIARRDTCLHKLKSRAQEFKSNRSDKLNATHWGKLMEEESISYTNGDINPEIKNHLKANNTDEELWTHTFFADFDDFNDVPYLNLLNNGNILKFCEFILRRNLIQCEMFPNLISELELWLTPVQKAKTDVKALDSHTLKTDKTTIALAEQLAANLCLCKHWTDNITETQIRDFTFGIMGVNTNLTETSKKQVQNLRAMLCSSKRAKSDSFRTTTLMIVGYLILKGKIDDRVSSRDLCRSIFTEDNWHATISKARKGDYGKTFSEVLPLIDENIRMHLPGQ